MWSYFIYCVFVFNLKCVYLWKNRLMSLNFFMSVLKMLLLLQDCILNVFQSRRLSRGIFIRLARRFRTTGSVVHPTYRRQGCRRTEENIINVLAYVNFDPQISIRTISGDLGISRFVVHRILQEHRYNTIFKKIKISQCT